METEGGEEAAGLGPGARGGWWTGVAACACGAEEERGGDKREGFGVTGARGTVV